MQRYRKLLVTSAAVLVTTLLAFVVLPMLSLTVDKSVNAPMAQAEVEQSLPTREELLRLINRERAKANIAPLVIDERLNQSAQRKADDMTKYNYFDHVSPNDGKHGYEYINDVGISCASDGENITQNFKDNNNSKAAIEAWTKSKPHHKAMLSQKYSSTGFGVSGQNIVQHFCAAK